MKSSEPLADAFGRIQEEVHSAVEGLTPDELSTRPLDTGNSIAWLVWHLTRIQDDHLADAGGYEQTYLTDGWYERLGLPFDPSDTGYLHSADDVAARRLPRALHALRRRAHGG